MTGSLDNDLSWLAAPKTPAEAKRHWMITRLWSGSLLAHLLLAVLIGALWLWPWPAPTATQRINFLGMVALALVGRTAIVDWSFSIGGPVGRWKARWKDAEASAEGDNSFRILPVEDAVVEQAYDGRTP